MGPTMSRMQVLPLLFLVGGATALAAPCENLASLTIPGTAIVSATAAPARAERPLPAFCRVQAVAKPVADSEIHVEIWLPESAGWNGKLLGTGNGGYSGAIGY